SLQQAPVRGIRWMTMSPDGRTIVVGEELPGESEGPPGRAVSLVDPRSGQFRELPGRLSFIATFSPDGHTLAVTEIDAEWYATSIKLLDTQTGKARVSIPVQEPLSTLGLGHFSPNGDVFVISHRVYPRREPHWKCTLQFFAAASGQEIASFPLDEDDT